MNKQSLTKLKQSLPLRGKDFTLISKAWQGFTLVEIMVVLGIISFLALLVVDYLRVQVFKGNDARRKTEVRRIATALEEYGNDYNCYPANALVGCSPGTGLSPYLQKIPCDPIFNTSYAYQNDGTACSKWFRLFSRLENRKDIDYQIGIGPGSAYNFTITSPNAP